MVWESRLRVVREHPISILILHGGDDSTTLATRRLICEVEYLAVSQINEDPMISHPRPLRKPVERYDSPKYWSRTVLLDFLVGTELTDFSITGLELESVS